MIQSRIAWAFAKHGVRALRGAALKSPFGHFEHEFTVWPHEADLTFVNHASYPVYFEAARWQLGFETGFAKAMRQRLCILTIGAQLVSYLRPLARGDRAVVHTDVIYADDRWWHFEHSITMGSKVHTRAWVRGVVRGRGGILGARELLELVGIAEPPPRDYNRVERLLAELSKSSMSRESAPADRSVNPG